MVIVDQRPRTEESMGKCKELVGTILRLRADLPTILDQPNQEIESTFIELEKERLRFPTSDEDFSALYMDAMKAYDDYRKRLSSSKYSAVETLQRGRAILASV